jgi:hypothetical protein
MRGVGQVLGGLLGLALPVALSGCAVVPVPGFVQRAEGPLPDPFQLREVGLTAAGAGLAADGSPSAGAAPCALAPGEAVAILDAEGDGADEIDPIRDYPARLHEWLAAKDPPVPVLDEAAFRDALFPWFEPGIEPLEPDAFAATVDKPLVRAKIEELGLRYLMVVRGRSRAGDAGLMPGLTLGPSLGMTVREETEVSAALWDLKHGAYVGEATVSAAGFWLFAPLPIGVAAAVPLTERTAYGALTDRLGAFFEGDVLERVGPDHRKASDGVTFGLPMHGVAPQGCRPGSVSLG